jgi:hypothetical protein
MYPNADQFLSAAPDVGDIESAYTASYTSPDAFENELFHYTVIFYIVITVCHIISLVNIPSLSLSSRSYLNTRVAFLLVVSPR